MLGRGSDRAPICSKPIVSEDRINNNIDEKIIDLLDNELQLFVKNSKCTKGLVPIIRNALLKDRETRREAHVLILEKSKELQKQFFDCMEALICFPDETVRGEAYYCLGEYARDRENINEQFLVKGLCDESDFVKACCANVLQNYVPLNQETLDLLNNEVILLDPSIESVNRRKLNYYAQVTLKTHYNYLYSQCK